MKDRGRTPGEMKEIYAFTVARRSVVSLKRIVNDGPRVLKTDYNAIGKCICILSFNLNKP